MQNIFFWLTRVFDLMLDWVPASLDLIPLILISIVTGFLVLVVYKYVSSPRQIKRSKEQIKGHILAIRLYKDEWRVIVKSFFLSLFSTLRYFAFNMIPLLILLPLLAPLFAQLEVRYGLSPFSVGSLAEVKVSFTGDLDGLEPRLVPASWYRQSMSPVFVMAHDQAHWQIEVLEPGSHDLEIETTRGRVMKTLRSGDDKPRAALSQKRHQGGILDGLLYPAETALETGSPALALQLNYPGRILSVAGLGIHWIWIHLLIVVVVVLILKKRFGIEF